MRICICIRLFIYTDTKRSMQACDPAAPAVSIEQLKNDFQTYDDEFQTVVLKNGHVVRWAEV